MDKLFKLFYRIGSPLCLGLLWSMIPYVIRLHSWMMWGAYTVVCLWHLFVSAMTCIAVYRGE